MHDLSENSPEENFSNESLMKYRISSRREQERLRRALEEQASWAREQQRIADEQRKAIERRQAELRKLAGNTEENAGYSEAGEFSINFFDPDGPLFVNEKRQLFSDFSEQFFFYSMNFSGQETPDCVVFVYSDIRDSNSSEFLSEETAGLKSFVTSSQELSLVLNDKPLARFKPVSYPIVMIIGLAKGLNKLKIRQSRLPFLFSRELKLPFELTESGTYAMQLITRYFDDRRRTIFGNKYFQVYEPKLRRLD